MGNKKSNTSNTKITKNQINKMSSNSILVKNKIHPAEFSNSNVNKMNTNDLQIYVANFNKETTRYHLMKNKIYLLCQENGKLMIYNIFKLKKIAEWDSKKNTEKDCQTFDTLLEILNRYDQTTLKSWFYVDIKLGVPTVTFKNENFFSNQMNFDCEYLEKILEKTNFFANTKNVSLDFIKFIDDMNISQMSSNSPSIHSKTFNSETKSLNKQNLHSSLQTFNSSKKNFFSTTSCGVTFAKIILNKYFHTLINKYSNYFDVNFYDTRHTLKKEISRMELELKNENLYTEEISNFFIYSTTDNLISVGPYIEDLNLKFKRPNFMKEVVKLV